ncbi:protein mono-ADP-ribosyltransferase PARP12 isoform X2 [Sardina pilchardus]|uniref:protein mono-ADP-ribosyltransferase PARP12 isoform X2 n=1 Tax=Sardina pilchardus TaxID=27697 RepID=UPI002E0EB136
MTTLVALSIAKILCTNQGCLTFRQVDQNLRQIMTVSKEVLFRVLSDKTKFFIVQGEESSCDLNGIPPDSLIIAKTDLRLCQDLKCSSCENLHLCRYCVSGLCRFGAKCKNPHTVDSPANIAILKRAGLSELNKEQLCCLLLQNDPYLLPEICGHYNKGNGEHGSCKFKSSCTSLHVCQHFLLGDCKFGATCKRAHTFDASSMKILNGRGVGPENIGHLQLIYKNRLLLSGHGAIQTPRVVKEADKPPPAVRQPSNTSVSEADRNEICLYFIRRGCSFKDKCIRVHHRLPYKWQILDRDGVTWTDLSEQEEVERAYCDPASDSSFGPRSVNFLNMTCAGSPVRRLSTASSVTKPPHFILTTEWRWYWMDDQGGWNEYGLESDPEGLTTITSQTLENIYLSDVEDKIDFSSGRHGYVLNLKGMYQVNTKHNTRRDVRRRPHFISAQELEKKLKSGSTEASCSSPVDVPAHWDKAALPSHTYKLVPVSSSSGEFQRVENLFKRTMQRRTIHSIQRVQNPSLWRMFQWQKAQLKESVF